MPRPTKGPRLGSGPTHQKMMLGGLASQLIMHERIRTTETKAKRLRPVADKLVTLGKQGSVHARRQALSLIEDREVVHKLFADVAPRFAERDGGYTRVLKLGPRQGDAAPMAIIEFVEESIRVAPQAEAEQKRRRGLSRRKPAKTAPKSPDQIAEDGAAAGGDEKEEEPGIMQGSPEETARAQPTAPGTPEDEPGTASEEAGRPEGELSAELGEPETTAEAGPEEPGSEDKG